MEVTTYALRMAERYYNRETFMHALRTAEYTVQSPFIPDGRLGFCVALALMHDLVEDTAYRDRAIELCWRGGPCYDPYLYQCLMLLSREKDTSYLDYIDEIRRGARDMPEAYIVKLADMKDHFAERDTLTPELAEKYMEALPHLL